MKKLNRLLVVLAVILVLGASVQGAMAYFTTYANADGGFVIHLGNKTEITETPPTDWTKHLVVGNQDGSVPVYVRAFALAGDNYTLTYSSPDGKWSDGGDGYWYYSEILLAGESSSVLDVKIGNIPAKENLEGGEKFNVVVLYESTPVIYDADGNPSCDWSAVLDTGTTPMS